MKQQYKKNFFYFGLSSIVLACVFSIYSAYQQSDQILKSLEKSEQQTENRQRTASALQISHFDSDNFNWIIKTKESNSDLKLDLITAKNVSVIRKNQAGEEELEIEGPIAQIDAKSKQVNFTEKTLIKIPLEEIEAVAKKIEILDKQPIKAENGFQLFFSPKKDEWIKSEIALVDLDFRHALLKGVAESPISIDRKDQNITKIKGGELELWFREESGKKNKKIEKIELREKAQLSQKDFLLNAAKMEVSFDLNSARQRPEQVEAFGNVRVKTKGYACTSDYLVVLYQNGKPTQAIFTGSPVAQKEQTKITGSKIIYSFKEEKVKILGNVRTI